MQQEKGHMRKLKTCIKCQKIIHEETKDAEENDAETKNTKGNESKYKETKGITSSQTETDFK